MKSRTIILLTVLFCGLGAALLFYFKPVASLEKSKADFTIQASDLFSAFNEDETVANSKYLDQIIAVSGRIASIDGSTLALETNSAFQVICEMEPGIDLSRLVTGDQVICKGVCTGKLMDVVLVRCVLQ